MTKAVVELAAMLVVVPEMEDVVSMLELDVLGRAVVVTAVVLAAVVPVASLVVTAVELAAVPVVVGAMLLVPGAAVEGPEGCSDAALKAANNSSLERTPSWFVSARSKFVGVMVFAKDWLLEFPSPPGSGGLLAEDAEVTLCVALTGLAIDM